MEFNFFRVQILQNLKVQHCFFVLANNLEILGEK